MNRNATKEQIVANATITKRYDELGYGDGFVKSERIKATIYDSLQNPNTDQ
jgi:hypothetical protein